MVSGNDLDFEAIRANGSQGARQNRAAALRPSGPGRQVNTIETGFAAQAWFAAALDTKSVLWPLPQLVRRAILVLQPAVRGIVIGEALRAGIPLQVALCLQGNVADESGARREMSG